MTTQADTRALPVLKADQLQAALAQARHVIKKLIDAGGGFHGNLIYYHVRDTDWKPAVREGYEVLDFPGGQEYTQLMDLSEKLYFAISGTETEAEVPPVGETYTEWARYLLRIRLMRQNYVTAIERPLPARLEE